MTQRINHADEALQYADWLEEQGQYERSQKLRKRYALKQFPVNWSGKENWTRTRTWVGTRAWTWIWTRAGMRTGTSGWTRTGNTTTTLTRTRTRILAGGTRTS